MAVHPLVALKNRYSRALLRLAGVVGVAAGRTDPSRSDSALSLVLYVEDASAAARLATTPRVREVMLALKAQGYGLKMILSGPFGVPPEQTEPTASTKDAPYQQAARPVQAGYSVGRQDPDGTGTCGLVVTDAATGEPLLLGNAHVLNGHNDDRDSTILQPGPADGGGDGDRVGALRLSTKLLADEANYMDAALVRVDADVSLDPAHPTLGALAGHCDRYGLGVKVSRVGRTSGEVHGVVEALAADVKVTFRFPEGEQQLLFVDQTLVALPEGATGPIQQAGDSGSVWVDEAEGLACAVSYAVSRDGSRSIAFPFVWAAQVMGVTVPPGGQVRSRVEAPDDEEPVCAEPLSDAQLTVARSRLITPGVPWVNTCPAAELEEPGPDDAVLEGEATQLTGDANGLSSYVVRLGHEDKQGNLNMFVFARVICVGKLPGSDAEQTYQDTFTETGEYWYYNPEWAYFLLDHDTYQVDLFINYSGAWGTSTIAQVEYALNAEALQVKTPTAILNPPSYADLGTGSDFKAFAGTLAYTGVDEDETEYDDELGVQFELVAGTVRKTDEDGTVTEQPVAFIGVVTWFRCTKGAPSYSLFQDAPTKSAGYSSNATTGLLTYDVLPTPPTDYDWYGFPDPR
ncbi:MAG: hypothetical protein H6739_27765 [Alphaproteobacteria bacterium]|nr:hypothetical protein [Alphaproteobacteria bacterium]